MKINKIFLLAGIAAMSMFMGACSDDDDYTPGPEVSDNCPALSFSSDNILSEELDPEDPTSLDITVYRSKTEGAGTYKINTLVNTDDAFNVPNDVTFAAGQSEAVITATFNNAEVGKTYTLEIGFDDADVNPYKTVKTYAYTVVRVKWNDLGTGQWLDGFWYGFWDEVTIQQRDDNHNVYRIKNPYTDDIVSQFGQPMGSTQEWFLFTLSKNGYVTWDSFFYINASYQDTGIDIKGYLPSSLSPTLEESDMLSKAVYDDEGNIRYFIITPYWYVDGVGGFGTNYPCYLAFPGVDLATEWEW